MGILLLHAPGLPDDNVRAGDVGLGDELGCVIRCMFSTDRVRPRLIHDLRGEGGAREYELLLLPLRPLVPLPSSTLK